MESTTTDAKRVEENARRRAYYAKNADAERAKALARYYKKLEGLPRRPPGRPRSVA